MNVAIITYCRQDGGAVLVLVDLICKLIMLAQISVNIAITKQILLVPAMVQVLITIEMVIIHLMAERKFIGRYFMIMCLNNKIMKKLNSFYT